MAGLMSRASTVVKARLSKLLDRAEDPSVTLDYSYEKQRELLQDVKRGIADVVTAKKRLQLQSTQLEQSIVKLEGQALTENWEIEPLYRGIKKILLLELALVGLSQ